MPPTDRALPNRSPEPASAYYYELEQWLDSAETATSHYQLLRVARGATVDEIKAAYVCLMRLHPSSRRVGGLNPGLQARVDSAFEKARQAYAVLTNLGKRIEYDNFLRGASGTFARPAAPYPPPASAPTPADGSYFLELGRFLDHVESCETHYGLLEVERSASLDDVKAAYIRFMRLHPKSRGVTLGAPEIRTRVERAFERLAGAFTALSSTIKRAEYDAALRKMSAPTRLEAPAPRVEAPAPSVQDDDVFEIEIVDEPPAAPLHDPGRERRRASRLGLSLPARVTGVDRGRGKWSELAHTVDVTRDGLAVELGESVHPGHVLHLLVPLPVKLRAYGLADQSYSVYAIVRRVEPPRRGKRVVGLEFVGERPPVGYLEKPWASFHTEPWGGRDRRRHPRHTRAEALKVTFLDEDMQSIGEARGATENVSQRGACIRLESPPPDVAYVGVDRLGAPFSSRAVVRNRFARGDGFGRLCVEFVGNEYPL